MSKFFFDSSHANARRNDEVGQEFATSEEAIIDAHGAAAELRVALALLPVSTKGWTIVVRNAGGDVVGSIDLAPDTKRLH